MSIMDQLAGMGSDATRIYKAGSGLVLAEVTNINDPGGLNRVKCRPLSLDEDVKETDWCFCMTPFGGNNNGIFFHPNVGDLAVLAYLGNDIHRPMLLGCFWDDKVKSPYKLDGEKNEIYSIMTPQKSEMKYTDTPGKEKIEITTPKKAKLALDDGEKKITLTDPDGKNKLTIDWAAGEIELVADKKLTLKTGSTKIILEAAGNITEKSSAKIDVQTAKLTEKTTASTVHESTGTMEVKGTASLTAESTGPTIVKGAIVKIN